MKWIVFDYGNVISYPPSSEVQHDIAETLKVSIRNFWNAYWRNRNAYDRGQISALTYWGDVCSLLDVRPRDVLIDRLIELDLRAWSSLNREMLTLLAEISSTKKVGLALLSNAPLEMARHIDGQPWADLFDHRFFSGDLHMNKPDLAVFRHVLDILNASAGDLYFVDDRPENTEGASFVGIPSVLFTGVNPLRKEAEIAAILARDKT